MPTVAEFAAELGIQVDEKDFNKADLAVKRLEENFVDMASKAKDASIDVKKAMETVALSMEKAEKVAEKAEKTGEKENDRQDKLLDKLKELATAYVGFEGAKRLKESIDETIELGASMGELADKTGTTVEEIQELGYAAQVEGLSTEFLAGTLAHLSVNLAAAGRGSQEQAQAFSRAGIKIRDASGNIRPAVDVLGDIADHIQALNEDERPAAAFELLGKQGKELIPLLKEGSKGLDEFREEARETGHVMSKETIESMVKLKEDSNRLSLAWQGLKQQALVTLIPKIKELVESMLAWIKANREMISSALTAVFNAVVVAVKALAVGLKVITTIAGWLIKNWPIAVALLYGMANAFLILKADAVEAGVAAMWAWIKAAAPFVLIAALIAAIILIIEDLYMAFTGGESVFKDMYDAVEEWLANKITELMDGVVGDIVHMFEAAFNWIWGKIKWIIDKLEWVGDRLKDAYHGVEAVFGSATGPVERAQQAASLGLSGDAAKNYIATGAVPGGMNGPGILTSPSLATDLRPVQATANVNNTYNITGDPDTVRRVVDDSHKQIARHLEAAIGGAKAKR